MMYFFRNKKISIALNSPEGMNDPNAISAYTGIIKSLQAEKRLHIEPTLRAKLKGLGATITIGVTTRPQDFPLLMALGGALYGMSRSPSYSLAEQERQVEMVVRFSRPATRRILGRLRNDISQKGMAVKTAPAGSER